MRATLRQIGLVESHDHPDPSSGMLGFGWLRDLPDARDYTPESTEVEPILASLVPTGKRARAAKAPSSVDLRSWCTPIENQGQIGSCTANAAVGVLEYFEQRATGGHIDASRLFVYKATRNLMKVTGDTGAYLRTAMGALALVGAAPEDHWRYVVSRFDEEPPPFCYAIASRWRATHYFRLDGDASGSDLVSQIKRHLAKGIPAMFGFPVYSSINGAASTGNIPFPTSGEKLLGGHAIVAVGYDDSRSIVNPSPKGTATTGAFLIRNSWGTGWGDAGYGWLPYRYAEDGLADDWWSLLNAEWVASGQFAA